MIDSSLSVSGLLLLYEVWGSIMRSRTCVSAYMEIRVILLERRLDRLNG